MKRKRFTEEQIVRILAEAEKLGNAAEIIRRENIGQSTFYKWKQKYAGMDVADLRKLKQLTEENRKLKTIIANQALDIEMLKEVNAKKW